MSSTFREQHIPDPPPNADKYTRDLVLAIRTMQAEIKRAFEDAEPLARLQPLSVLPARYSEGDEGEFAAGVAGVSAGKYVYRGGSWVFIG